MLREHLPMSDGPMLQDVSSSPDVEMTGDTPHTSFSSAMDIDSAPAIPSSSTSSVQDSSITEDAPPAFKYFSRIEDKDIRDRIWHFAIPPPRTHFVEVYGYTGNPRAMPKIRYIPPLPATFHATHESSALSISVGGGTLIHFNADVLPPRSFYFNVSLDTIFLSSRFAAHQDSTETQRLVLLGTMLVHPVAAHVQRIVVTYSAADDYSLIGGTLRPFARLETLYLAMSDMWSDRFRLAQGWPGVDVEAGRIREEVERTEAEETDDDEEGEGERAARGGGRAERRIVECELRLDE